LGFNGRWQQPSPISGPTHLFRLGIKYHSCGRDFRPLREIASTGKAGAQGAQADREPTRSVVPTAFAPAKAPGRQPRQGVDAKRPHPRPDRQSCHAAHLMGSLRSLSQTETSSIGRSRTTIYAPIGDCQRTVSSRSVLSNDEGARRPRWGNKRLARLNLPYRLPLLRPSARCNGQVPGHIARNRDRYHHRKHIGSSPSLVT